LLVQADSSSEGSASSAIAPALARDAVWNRPIIRYLRKTATLPHDSVPS
jgi:hypothetical protein